MTKKELFEKTKEILVKYNASSELTEELTELLKPGKGGQRVRIEDITKVVDGKVVELQCRLSGVWLPATTDYFYPEADSKIVGVDGVGLSRTSRQAKKIANDFNSMKKATNNAIVADLLAGDIDRDEANRLIAEIPASPDYSSVSAELPEEQDAE